MRFISLLLSSLVALNPIWAQTGTAAADAPLHLNLVDNPGPAQPQTASAKGFVLQVTGADGSPVSGAAVALRLPEDGPTGIFSNGLRAWVSYSDNAGIARFPTIQWGEATGDLQLKATAAKGALHAGLSITQRVSSPAPASISIVSVPVHTAPAPGVQILLPELHSTYSAKPFAVESTNEQTAAVAKPSLPPPPDILSTPQPGALFRPLADVPPMNTASTGATAPKEKPHTLTPNPPAPDKQASSEPTVTITNTGAGGSESHKKTWIILGIAAGAGGAALAALLGHGAGGAAGSSGSTSGVTIGAPTITVGH